MNHFQSIVYNWHITEMCNYRCEYCFSEWNSREPEIWRRPEEAVDLVRMLAGQTCDLGVFEKFEGISMAEPRLNFAGGEPLILGDLLPNLIREARSLGMRASLITNGSLLAGRIGLVKDLDLLGISVDSVRTSTLEAVGRCSRSGKVLTFEALKNLVAEARALNPGLTIKFNIVAGRRNLGEEVVGPLLDLDPHKIKVFRQLPFGTVPGITDEEFAAFRRRNNHPLCVYEDNLDMTQSYLMIDPWGRFFQNGGEEYVYSDPILEAGLTAAAAQIPFRADRFLSRYAASSTEGVRV